MSNRFVNLFNCLSGCAEGLKPKMTGVFLHVWLSHYFFSRTILEFQVSYRVVVVMASLGQPTWRVTKWRNSTSFPMTSSSTCWGHPSQHASWCRRRTKPPSKWRFQNRYLWILVIKINLRCIYHKIIILIRWCGIIPYGAHHSENKLVQYNVLYCLYFLICKINDSIIINDGYIQIIEQRRRQL